MLLSIATVISCVLNLVCMAEKLEEVSSILKVIDVECFVKKEKTMFQRLLKVLNDIIRQDLKFSTLHGEVMSTINILMAKCDVLNIY